MSCPVTVTSNPAFEIKKASFDDEEDYEEWEAMIGPHATEVTEEDINDPEYMKWFNTLEIIYDERNS